MESEDLIQLPGSGSDSGRDRDSTLKLNDFNADHEVGDDEGNEDKLFNEDMEQIEHGAEIEEGQLIPGVMFCEDTTAPSSILVEGVDIAETSTVIEDLNHASEHGENGCGNVQTTVETDDTCVKRDRMTFKDEHPSVHIKYNSLPRDSIRKLEELIQQWSKWHARYCSASQELESGEKTYFPAINVGEDRTAAVSFWIDNQLPQNNINSMDDDSVPLYDRGYGVLSLDGPTDLEGELEPIDNSRCFNCGSYNHSLKECPKPRNNNAVNSARKEHKSRRNQTPGSRNASRYYQSSPGGKFEGLRPGALDAETRKFLGLGELDPPPWLNRMRETGYPPGYLDLDDEDEPSGIIIFDDEDKKNDEEEGEIQADPPEPRWKKSVPFPGINAPIPENADRRLWAERPSGSYLFQSREYGGFETYSRGRYREQRNSWDLRDDSHPDPDPRNRSSRFNDDGSMHRTRSPTHGRYPSERSRNNGSVSEESHALDSRSSYSRRSPSRRFSHQYDSYDDDRDDHSSRSRDNRWPSER
ncbi:Zinc finger CCHC domain-containing protein [Drosera capensis]